MISTTLYQPHGDNDLINQRLRPSSCGTSIDQHHVTNRGARVALHKASLSPPVISFPDHSKAVLLLWIYFFVFSVCDVCFLQPCGHLLGKGSPLGSLSVMFHCAFVTFQYGVLGKVWYLIVSIPGLSFLSKYLTLLEIMTQLTRVGWSASTLHTIICFKRMTTTYLTK